MCATFLIMRGADLYFILSKHKKPFILAPVRSRAILSVFLDHLAAQILVGLSLAGFSLKCGSIFNKVGKKTLFSVVCSCPNEERAEILDTQAEKLDTQASHFPRIIKHHFSNYLP